MSQPANLLHTGQNDTLDSLWSPQMQQKPAMNGMGMSGMNSMGNMGGA